MTLSGLQWTFYYLCQHNARLFNALRYSIFFMEDHVIFKGKFSLTLQFLNFKPPNPRNYVPTNALIFINPRKLGPAKINDFTVSPSHQMVLRNCWETSNQTRPMDQTWSRLGFWSSCQQKLLQPWYLCSNQVSTVDECRETGQWIMLSPFLRRETIAQHPITERFHSPPSIQK